jgi:hypothetical protein
MAVTWQVVATREVSEVLADGRVGDVWIVTFRTSLGTTGSVRIPDDIYTAEIAAQMIAAKVERASLVDSLTGEVE